MRLALLVVVQGRPVACCRSGVVLLGKREGNNFSRYFRKLCCLARCKASRGKLINILLAEGFKCIGKSENLRVKFCQGSPNLLTFRRQFSLDPRALIVSSNRLVLTEVSRA